MLTTSYKTLSIVFDKFTTKRVNLSSLIDCQVKRIKIDLDLSLFYGKIMCFARIKKIKFDSITVTKDDLTTQCEFSIIKPINITATIELTLENKTWEKSKIVYIDTNVITTYVIFSIIL